MTELEQLLTHFSNCPNPALRVFKLVVQDRDRLREQVKVYREFLEGARQDLIDGDYENLIGQIEKVLEER